MIAAADSGFWRAAVLRAGVGARESPRYLIPDRDGCFGAAFNRRVQSPGIVQIRTPVKAPKRLIKEYVAYYNGWGPHRSLEQKAPCRRRRRPSSGAAGRIVAEPILGGLPHVYRFAA